MRSNNEQNQQAYITVTFDVTLPLNLVHQTIAYLEVQSDPMAVMLVQHYKHWLQMSKQQRSPHSTESIKV